MTEEQERNQATSVSAPTRHVSDTIWLIVAGSFAVVFVGSFFVEAAGVFVAGQPGLVPAGTIADAREVAASFLAGLLAGHVLQRR